MESAETSESTAATTAVKILKETTKVCRRPGRLLGVYFVMAKKQRRKMQSRLCNNRKLIIIDKNTERKT